MDSMEEKRIWRIITRIQANRNTACYQSILAFAKREDKDLTMDSIKVTINKLVERDIIFNKNKGNEEKMESFKITKGGESAFVSNTGTISQDGDEENTACLEQFINESFYDALINKIKDEVKIAINDQLNNLNHIISNTPNKNVDNEHIISQLNKEINYLKQELLSKNNII